MTKAIETLEPRALWKNFSALNAVPRASKKEARVIEFMKNFGQKLGLETHVDAAGNVVIKKPATPGMEDRKTVILQSHLDMVHQKNADTDFDFETEGIRMLVEDGWVRADGTTLGADNGIGVAAIMAILESEGVPHPAIEALFTIDEETGMTGAKELQGDLLSGDILLNLDTEEDNELCIGCAGGVDTNTFLKYDEVPTHSDGVAFKISVTGLKGGHSGMDIHLGRGNANKLMNRLLFKNTDAFDMQIAEVDGGGLRNAIPRESFSVVVVPAARKAGFLEELARRKTAVLNEYRTIEPDLTIEVSETTRPEKAMNPATQRQVLRAIYAVPNGVFRMSPDIPDLVETSSSFARVLIKNGEFTTQSLQRSSIESGKEDVANAIRATFELIGARVENGNDYPGWAPNAQSPVLKTMTQKYREMYGEAPHVAACHAGLECGIIGTRKPGLDMISFGPTIRGAHSPDEKVSIESVQKFWKFLLATLRDIPTKS
ncbi:MAG: aminoacyl-histidine dipeptidase [Bacteroidetes bacterium]|nr:MAG: aminoacyl-histidine dipeptidase [Bacteroidota bacterium]